MISIEYLTKKEVSRLEKDIFEDYKKIYGKCCKCERTENLTLDHIIPKRILINFGIDSNSMAVKENYQLLCRICNHFKGDQLDFANSKTKKLLLELLEII